MHPDAAESAGSNAEPPEPGPGREPRVLQNHEKSRFEVYVGDELAGYARYRIIGAMIKFTHTEVKPVFQGEGLASELARVSLDAAREQDLSVLPVCPYMNDWIRRHREYAELVPVNRRADFGL